MSSVLNTASIKHLALECWFLMLGTRMLFQRGQCLIFAFLPVWKNIYIYVINLSFNSVTIQTGNEAFDALNGYRIIYCSTCLMWGDDLFSALETPSTRMSQHKAWLIALLESKEKKEGRRRKGRAIRSKINAMLLANFTSCLRNHNQKWFDHNLVRML